ncbi:MAG: glycosyl transferase [Rhizobiaceae bacterium]|nr:glycosyl transferase [Rhizobiaceae bacterium]
MRGPKILFYVQHLLGIGHLARASRIASALVADGFDLTMVTGGAPVPGFPAAGVKTFALPPVVASDIGFSGLAAADGTPADQSFLDRRRDSLLAQLHLMQPDIVMLEAFPFGRRQMRFELMPLLREAAAMSPRPKVVVSVRDILQERMKPGRNEETSAIVEEFVDRVLIHGDPSFARLEDTFPPAERIADKVIYTGLVAGPPSAPVAEPHDVLVSAGGGAAGRDLVFAAVSAARLLPPDLGWCVITGPNLAAADFERLAAEAPANVALQRFRPEFPALLANAGVSVSQAGYNTVCDILRAGCRSVLVPFAAGGETEQSVRAERLARIGLATMLSEAALSAQSLAAAIETARTSPPPGPNGLDLEGARHTAIALRELG